MEGQVGITTNWYLKLIQEGLLGYPPPINALTKQKRVMRCAMRKPQDLLFKRFSSRLTELNDYLPLSPGSSAAKKMAPEELNRILRRVIPNSCARQACIKEWYFEGRYYKDTCEVFENIEIAESIYKVGAPYQNTQQAESDRASIGKGKKEGASTSPSNPEKGRAGKHKRNNAVHPSDATTGEKKTCLLHGPGKYL